MFWKSGQEDIGRHVYYTSNLDKKENKKKNKNIKEKKGNKKKNKNIKEKKGNKNKKEKTKKKQKRKDKKNIKKKKYIYMLSFFFLQILNIFFPYI